MRHQARRLGLATGGGIVSRGCLLMVLCATASSWAQVADERVLVAQEDDDGEALPPVERSEGSGEGLDIGDEGKKAEEAPPPPRKAAPAAPFAVATRSVATPYRMAMASSSGG